MGWWITCADKACGEEGAWASDIVDLIANHRDDDGWFICRCGKRGYIEKRYDLQEGDVWRPFLRGIITLGDEGDTYQPFVFVVSDEPTSKPDAVWFSYYKDLRPRGRLKLGHGPGGPPVRAKAEVLRLLHRLIETGCLTKREVQGVAG